MFGDAIYMAEKKHKLAAINYIVSRVRFTQSGSMPAEEIAATGVEIEDDINLNDVLSQFGFKSVISEKLVGKHINALKDNESLLVDRLNNPIDNGVNEHAVN